jgi:hypothetical protein
MSSKNYITSKWIIIWGILTLMFTWLTETTQNIWIFWTTIVSAAILVGGLIITTWKFANKSMGKRTLFTPMYQDSKDAIAFNHQTEASDKQQRVEVTLRMALETHVEFVAVLFRGEGTIPTIQSLDDWQYGIGNRPDYISISNPINDTESRFWWRYKTPEHRNKSSRITIGINYLATDYFNGHLEFQMTTIDGAKDHPLPFKVIKKSKV